MTKRQINLLDSTGCCASLANRTFRVYRNLHKKCWSLLDVETRLVHCHANEVALIDVKPVVYEAGRLRVCETRRKVVHAFVQGRVYYGQGRFAGDQYEVKYNPYLCGEFKEYRFGTCNKWEPVAGEVVLFTRAGKVLAYRPNWGFVS